MNQQDALSVLDPKQLARIEAVHRGFMYQHLYATGCLLVSHGRSTSIRVERDEDVEAVSQSGTTYIQVKTRSRPLLLGDIEGAFERFTALLAEHASARRTGEARFVVVANVAPSPALMAHLQGRQLPPGTSLIWPEGLIGPPVDDLPPAWSDVASGARWCSEAAVRLPHRLIGADTLVWKLAANVALAASGTPPYADHSFRVDELPALFEQVLLQMQDFPEPLHHYRPQEDEPRIDSREHLRIICGYSGAGKTSWAAQAAVHSPSNCAYYDAADTAPAVLATALVRETAAQLAGARAPLERVLAPGVSGLESLRALDDHLAGSGQSNVLVIDNAHCVPASTLHSIVRAMRHTQVVLLCQPVPMIAELEALTGVPREELRGWTLEEVAAEVAELGCHGPVSAIDRVRTLTGGYPLFVQGAARVGAAEYGGNLVELCTSIDHGLHASATPQEAILRRVFEGFQPAVRHAIGVLSLSDVALSRVEAIRLLREGMEVDEPNAAGFLRQLRTLGPVQVSGADRIRVHDAMKILGKLYVRELGDESVRKGLESLRGIIFESLHQQRDVSRFGFFARLLASLNDLAPLIDLMGEELFHEIGVIPEVTDALARALELGGLSPEQQFWAHDGLIFAALKHGGEGARVSAQRSLQAMDQLLSEGVLTPTQQASLWMKRLHYEAAEENASGVMHALDMAAAVLPDDREHIRIYVYNAATALHSLAQYEAAEELAQRVVAEYFEHLNITPGQVSGSTQPELLRMLGGEAADTQDIKHLADALDLLAMTHAKQGQRVSLARLHAMRFYEISGAVDSVVRTGLDVADAFVWVNDFEGAREVMENHVLPYVQRHRLLSKLLDARSLYAVILAYSGRFDDAELEMSRLAPLLADAPAIMQAQIATQWDLIRNLRHSGVPPQRRLRIPAAGRAAVVRSAIAHPFGKVGRNEPCPCGSGLKFKKCHGAIRAYRRD